MDNNPKTKVSGVIEDVVYYNENNNYTVLNLLCDDGLLICAVGFLPMPSEGERLTLEGKWGFHREFGRQFEISAFEKALPTEKEGIYKFLTSAGIKGLGPKTARRIVDKYGEDTFDVIENHPEWLTDVQGITYKRAAEISSSFNEKKGLRDILEFCKNYLRPEDAIKLYRKLGPFATGIVLDNPYILCEGKEPLPFAYVDKMAMDMGFNPVFEERIQLGFEYTLTNQMRLAGHTCLPRGEFLRLASKLMELEYEFLDEKLTEAQKKHEISSMRVEDEEYIMLNEVAHDEIYIAKKLGALESRAISYGVSDIGALIEKAELYTGIKYASMQKKAIAEALLGGVMLLTGGPGTGKTTVVKAIISIFESLGLKTVLAAPTGRAAKRLCETTGEEAKTVHRLLEIERTTDKEIRFGRDEANPISESVIIIDEVSMMDTWLTACLLRAVRPGARLILIGDANQLPSVGGGNVLSDMLESGMIRYVTLNEIFRQSEESLIVSNAHKINQGIMPDISSATSDFFFLRRDDEDEIRRTVADLITERLPRAYGKDIGARIQTITPSRVGSCGVNKLNEELQARLNPKSAGKPEKTAHGTLFREGDRVMQVTNNYELNWTRGDEEGFGVFNGDIGVITKINNPDNIMTVDFDGKRVFYSYDLLEELELAYAITVHKSQGSEYPVVIIPMYSCPPMLMTRNLVYTAVTRAKSMVIMVGRAEILAKMVENNREIKRYTTLKERLIAYL